MALDQDNVVTIEHATVYDNGRWPVLQINATSGALSGTLYNVVAATAGQRVKVLSCIVICNAFVTAGNIELHDGVTAFPIGALSAVGSTIYLPSNSTLVYQTGLGFALGVLVRGAATVTTSVTYYKAP